jgi:hypothetical protein
VVSLAAVAGLFPVASVCSEELPTVAPDRPSVTNSAQTVPRGFAQVETGGEYIAERLGSRTADQRAALQATVRIGLLDRLEARVESRPVVWLRSDGERTGAGDVTLGLKYRFLDAPEGSAWPSLGVLPFVKIPTAKEPIGSGRPDAGASLLASFELPLGFSLDANAGVTAVGQSRPHGFLPQGSASGSVSHALTERLSAFAELAWQSKEERGGRHQLLVDAGLTYRVLRWLAVDAGVSTTVSGAGPEFAARAGLTVLIGR